MMIQHVQNIGMFQRFLHSQLAGSLVLLVSTIIAVGWTNSRWGQLYYDLAHTDVGVSFGEANFKLTLSHWIKDGLMAIFFFVVGLEIRREIVVGELSSLDKALLPVCTATAQLLMYSLVHAGCYSPRALRLAPSGPAYRCSKSFPTILSPACALRCRRSSHF